jgi:Mg2+/Co2+ transporter CorB
MPPDLLLFLFAILALNVVSAFFSAAETGLTAASKAQLHSLAKAKNRSAVVAEKLLGQQDRMIGTVLLGNNLANILGTALATQVSMRYFEGGDGVAVATAVMTVVILIFAEVLPKTYAVNHAEKTALLAARPMQWIMFALYPAVMAVQWVIRGVFKLMRVQYEAERTLTQSELQNIISLYGHQGAAEKGEKEMLASILDLSRRDLASVMAPRRDIVSVDADMPVDKICDAVLESAYTRIPLWRGKQENVIAVLHAKALLREVRRHKGSLDALDVVAVAREPWFVPETNTLDRQLLEFRRRREHMALVVDEYGDIVGLVTLEDILEEIVGQIRDETDVKEIDGMAVLDESALEASGETTVYDVNKRMDWHLPDEHAYTAAGLLMHYAERIPEPGEECEGDGYRFVVLEKAGNAVVRVRIERLAEEGEGE